MKETVGRLRHALRMAALPLFSVLVSATASCALADTDASPAAEAKHAQNPVASLVSIPFQNNTYFDVGPYQRREDVLIVEPVVPFKLGDNWNLISRWITPLIYQPQISPLHGSTFGLGNIEAQFYFSPANPGSIIWGIGPQVWLPTATDRTIGVNKFGGGPAFVAVRIQGPWLFGVLANQTWAGRADHHVETPFNTFADDKVNQALFNPFFFYNKPGGWYYMSSPIVTAQWSARGGDVWTVPVGGGFGRVFRIGNQMVNARMQVFDNVHRPQYAPTWQVQLQLQLLYPTGHH